MTTALSDAIQLFNVTGAEDCLTLDIQRLSGTTAGANSPVMLSVHGDGFKTGSSGATCTSFNATTVFRTAESLGHPILYVAINYRLGSFGFLGAQEIQSDGSNNLGLRDQRLAL
ncbi:hypothetical protein MMC14_000841 [Varicellaria rhodocarpa]|nr:hypothetical protein [Varicellaria rhodocarpa]